LQARQTTSRGEPRNLPSSAAVSWSVVIVRFSSQHDHRISQRFVGSCKSPKQPQYEYYYTNNEHLFHGIIFFMSFLVGKKQAASASGSRG
jgi:hypothetical protein